MTSLLKDVQHKYHWVVDVAVNYYHRSANEMYNSQLRVNLVAVENILSLSTEFMDTVSLFARVH